mgnify:CR=1 FL=1|jgi:hypothetical protein
MLQINSRHAIIIIIIIIIIYCLLIILSYKKTNKQYKYSDLNNDQLTSSYFEKKILSRLPIIIWHNDFNIDLDNTLLLLTPGLLIKKYFISNYSNADFISYHKTDRLFIVAKTHVIIHLYPPSIYYETNKANRNQHKDIYDRTIKDNKKLNNMEIELQPQDVLYIPRFWYFTISQTNSVDLYICNTVLSSLSSLFI